MKLDAILPEVYTFIELLNHEYHKARRKGDHSLSTHLAGGIPDDHPMPYNVYIPIRDFLKRNPDQVDELVDYLYTELSKREHGFKSVTVGESSYYEKKFIFKKEFPQIDVSVEW